MTAEAPRTQLAARTWARHQARAFEIAELAAQLLSRNVVPAQEQNLSRRRAGSPEAVLAFAEGGTVPHHPEHTAPRAN